MQKLTFLDKEYLTAFIKGDMKKARKYRRAGATVIVPRGFVFQGDVLEPVPLSDTEANKILKEQERQERAESRRDMAYEILEGRDPEKLRDIKVP